jgi:hypothetical protein
VTEPLHQRETGETSADSFADEILDEILPSSMDWHGLVRRYPRASLVTAAAAGFWIGRRHGTMVVTAVGAWVAGQVSDAMGSVLGQS